MLPLTQQELNQIPLVLLAGEYWFADAQRWKKAYDLQFAKTGKVELRLMQSLKREKLLEMKAEEIKPTFWQQPYMIVGYVIVAGITGLWIGSAFE